MVEYALILAQNASGNVAHNVASWASQVQWETVAYLVLGLVTLRMAVSAFRPTR